MDANGRESESAEKKTKRGTTDFTDITEEVIDLEILRDPRFFPREMRESPRNLRKGLAPKMHRNRKTESLEFFPKC
jgi:hypothetical protein